MTDTLRIRLPHPLPAEELAVCALYQHLLESWNARAAHAMAGPLADAGVVIGFDGSQMIGPAAVVASLEPIFQHHRTPAYLAIVRSVRMLGPDVALLRADVGMTLPDESTVINPALHARQTLVATKHDGTWRVDLLQTTPAQLHGRPDLVEQLSNELRHLLD